MPVSSLETIKGLADLVLGPAILVGLVTLWLVATLMSRGATHTLIFEFEIDLKENDLAAQSRTSKV